MTNVLIYGDSNVWGDTPNARRLPDNQQWASILAKKLGKNIKIIQEGLCGRYAGGFEYHKRPYYNGQLHFEPIYRTALPVDLVILALGTNDMKKLRYHREPSQIAEDILWYEPKVAQIIANYPNEKMPQFLYILPPNFAEDVISERPDDTALDENVRREVNKILKMRVKNFVEINDIKLSADGAHFSPLGHQQMAEAVFAKIKKIESGKNDRNLEFN